ncbi:MAG TPA: lytic transglycosylase domain-containing protein, partial [Acidobacteriota bacterium]|nr:lytic transglycosylase domain-containing protein [Acidobacteriota bacterium]
MNRYRIIVKKITVIKNRLRFLWLITAICSSTLFADLCIASPGLTVSSSVDSKTLDVTMADTSQPSHDDIIYSNTMEGLMRASRTRFVEGFRFIRTGYFESAQKEFDAAVDMVLQSGWELAYAPTLREFFQDLIEQIHYAESNYVYVSQDIEDEDYEEHLIEGYEHLDLNTITDNPAIREALASGLPKNNFEIPITINEMVIKSMDFWLNQGNRQFMEGLRRSGRYYPMIERIFREESIPLDVIHLAQVESLFKPQALSRARAKGIWQFMERTGRQYGLKITRDIDERSDPELSTRAAARYLNDLYAMFNDWNLVLAAYNWGEGRLRQLINSTGLNDFWELANLRRRMPNETRNHVPLIKASVILAKNP